MKVKKVDRFQINQHLADIYLYIYTLVELYIQNKCICRETRSYVIETPQLHQSLFEWNQLTIGLIKHYYCSRYCHHRVITELILIIDRSFSARKYLKSINNVILVCRSKINIATNIKYLNLYPYLSSCSILPSRILNSSQSRLLLMFN